MLLVFDKALKSLQEQVSAFTTSNKQMNEFQETQHKLINEEIEDIRTKLEVVNDMNKTQSEKISKMQNQLGLKSIQLTTEANSTKSHNILKFKDSSKSLNQHTISDKRKSKQGVKIIVKKPSDNNLNLERIGSVSKSMEKVKTSIKFPKIEKKSILKDPKTSNLNVLPDSHNKDYSSENQSKDLQANENFQNRPSFESALPLESLQLYDTITKPSQFSISKLQEDYQFTFNTFRKSLEEDSTIKKENFIELERGLKDVFKTLFHQKDYLQGLNAQLNELHFDLSSQIESLEKEKKEKKFCLQCHRTFFPSSEEEVWILN